jgi:hypothetical protein
MKPFIKIRDHYINLTTILYIQELEGGDLWVAFDLDGQKGLRVTGEQAQELTRLLSPLVWIAV